MGTSYMISSAVLLLLEIILQLYVVVISSRESGGIFVAFLAFIILPVIVVNFVSAIQVTKTKDFTGRRVARIVCILFHSFQFGLFWRALKLAILYDKKDWSDYLNMRLFHCGFQSLPFAVTLSHTMFKNDVRDAAHVITVIVTLVSAAVTLTLYRTGNKVYEPGDFDSNKAKNIRKHVGVVFLGISTALMLLSRCGSIVLFSIVQPKWVALPVGLHFLIHAAAVWCRTDCGEGKVFVCATKILCLSFVNIFDMTGKDYGGVKCSYVLFYTALLVENLVMSSFWMLTSDAGEMLRLMTVLVVIMCFIIGIIMKFASCGCIFNVESDILSDAFNNPELKEEKEFGTNIEVTQNKYIKPDYEENERPFMQRQLAQEDMRVNDTSLAAVNNRAKSPSLGKLSNDKTSSTSSHKVLHTYDNQAFTKSQGNISVSLGTANESHSRSRGSHERSRDSHKRSHDSKGSKSRDSNKLSNDSTKKANSRRSRESKNMSSDSADRKKKHKPKTGTPTSFDEIDYSFDIYEPSLTSTIDNSERTKMRNRQRLKVSDKSILATAEVLQTPLQQPKFNGPSHMKASNADLASSNSRYSRNTNTLNGSVQNYRYNGFNDPYREKRLMELAQQKQAFYERHKKHCPHKLRDRFANFSLDSSELYPSMTSDTSSMTSASVYHPDIPFSNNKKRQGNKHRRNKNRKLPNRTFALNDGYSTDVSNSDYLSSLNDFSMTDSASWTESSSSSDGALTWPPSHSSNLLKMYNIPDKVSSQDNVMLWLDTMESCMSENDTSFSTMREPSIASETDISLSAMQTFEVKKEKKRFRKLLPKPKDVILKFRSLNYKGKEKNLRDRPYPLSKTSSKAQSKDARGQKKEIQIKGDNSHMKTFNGTTELPAVPLPVDSVQESVV